MDYIKRQKRYLKGKGLIAFIAFLCSFIPMSTDLYLPALPSMAEYFGAPVSMINLTLILFFVFYSIGMLIWGPLSDKYGRKIILLTGTVIYISASIFCACAGDINHLIISRVFQAVGGGAVTAVEIAMIKDIFEGRKREAILALVQSMVMLTPIVAPVFGAIILQFVSWRGIFWALSFFGIVAMFGGFALKETVTERYEGTITQTMGRLFVVLKNPGFSSLLFTFSLVGIPMMAYVASSSYIFINRFGLTELQYSYYYLINAICLPFGPILYMRLSKRFDRRSIITTCFVIMVASGILIFAIGSLGPLLFAFSILPITIFGGTMRPPSANLMLEQQQGDIGSASSLMGFVGLMMASVGMLLISLDWANMILILGILNFITGLICGSLWVVISKKPFIKQIPDIVSAD